MRKTLALLVFVFACIVQTLAQSRTIKGKVSDEKGAPLIGVSVNALAAERKVIATAITDATGSYTITVSEKVRSLQFSYVGMDEQTVQVGGKSFIEVKLVTAGKDLSEVVVVGYGTQRRKETTGSLATVKGSEVAERPVQSFESGLAGKSAGVQITMPSGVVNAPPVFRIRGTNSISLSSYPLVVVDGVPTFTDNIPTSTNAANNPLASINPNDIESIDIAKDAAATAIYGSRAANGVVFITTKKGRAGKLKVSYDGWVGWNSATRLPNVLNAADYIAFKTSAVNNYNALAATPTSVKYNSLNGPNGNPIDTKWADYIYRTGVSSSHNVNLMGGNENTTYYFSLGYTAQQGIIKKNDFQRINTLFNVDSKVGKYVTLGGKISYSNEMNLAATSSGSLTGEAFNTGGLGRLQIVLPSIISPYNNDGTYNLNGAAIGSSNISGIASLSYYNPVPLLDLNRSNTENNHIQSNAYVQIKPAKWITLKSLYGIDYLYVDNDLFWSPVAGDGYSYNGYAWAATGKYKTWLWTNTAQFDYTFATKHNVSLLAGNEQQRRTSYGYGINRQGLSDPAYNQVQAGWVTNNPAGMVYGENYLLSNFGRLTYNFDKKYFISGNIRQDEYSALGQKKGTFWGISGKWEVTKENFWKTAGIDKVLSSFSLRGSYGKVGNIAGIGDYTPYSTFSSGLYGGASTLYYAQVGNNNLRWETSTKTDVGFAFGLLKDRITGEITYYKNNIDGLILNVPQSPSTGLPSNPPANVGTMYNKGLEVSVNASIINKKDFSWSTSFNITFNKNEVTALAPGITSIQTGTSGLETVNQTMPGYSLGYLWVIRTGGVDPATGKRIFINSAGTPVYYSNVVNSTASPKLYNYSLTADGKTQYISPTGGSSITQAADARMYANVLPKQYGGWSNSFKYKNFDLDVLFTYQLGFYLYYGTNAGLHDQRWWNNSTDVLTDAWAKPGDAGKTYAKPVYGDNVSNGSAMPLDINVFKGDFVKLRNITFGYRLPENLTSKAKISSLRIYVSGQNLGIFTKYPGPDPEVSSNGNSTTAQGVDRNTGANARTVTVGINIGF
ncbi:MAG: SusC/RagA family TonB-linked outer membrane protein [Bacteroidota bacterium]|nr:SusC/RagA family TonB-linked outer membrane protein [Bacteroidota bacterium]